MIDPKELRIGNYIIEEDGCMAILIGMQPYDHSVRCDEKEGCDLLVDVFEADGVVTKGCLSDSKKSRFIELTPNWLERCGEKCPSGQEWEYQIRVGALYWYFRWNTEWYSEIGGIYIDSKVQYVHQMQNLYFALTGKEISIRSFNQSN